LLLNGSIYFGSKVLRWGQFSQSPFVKVKLALRMLACLTKATFLGAMALRPFFGAAAALAACREEEAFDCNPLVFP
jgi:hypothetical protein